MPVPRTCQYCQRIFFVSLSTIAQGKGLYCSRACYHSARGVKATQSCICVHCGKSFERWQCRQVQDQKPYCSRQCFRLSRANDIESNFWQRILRCAHDPACPYCCWLWQGRCDPDGYGIVSVRDYPERAHRHMWELHNKRALPAYDYTYIVRHLCSVPACCNPMHLMLGSPKENSQDMVVAGRSLRGDRNRMRKLTQEQVQDIRLSAAQGVTHKALGTLFGVTNGHITDIIKRKVWRHIP